MTHAERNFLSKILTRLLQNPDPRPKKGMKIFSLAKHSLALSLNSAYRSKTTLGRHGCNVQSSTMNLRMTPWKPMTTTLPYDRNLTLGSMLRIELTNQ